MKLINQYKIKYINHLLRSKAGVLRGDTKRGDSPTLEIYNNSDEKSIILQVSEGVKFERMRTSPDKGAKDRLDIHFGPGQLGDITEDLKSFAKTNNLVMDNSTYNLYDPRGKEHSSGLRLGEMESLATIPAISHIYYSDLNTVASGRMIYIDAENYYDKLRYHIGSQTSSIDKKTSINRFEVIIPHEFVVRFIKTLELADIIFKGSFKND